MKVGLGKVETSLYRVMQNVLVTLNRLGVNYDCDRRTGRQNRRYQ